MVLIQWEKLKTQQANKYSHSLLVSENNDLRAKIEQAEQEKFDMKQMLMQIETEHTPSTGLTRDDSLDLSPSSMKRAMKLNEDNSELEKRIEYLQSNERKLKDKLLEGYPKPNSSSSRKSGKSHYMKFKMK
jgi:hypothetical protein